MYIESDEIYIILLLGYCAIFLSTLIMWYFELGNITIHPFQTYIFFLQVEWTEQYMRFIIQPKLTINFPVSIYPCISYIHFWRQKKERKFFAAKKKHWSSILNLQLLLHHLISIYLSYSSLTIFFSFKMCKKTFWFE